MNTLKEDLVLTDAKIILLSRHPTKDGLTDVLSIKAKLTPEVADIISCRNRVYNLDDNPWPSLKVFGLDHEISSCELSIAGYSRLRPMVVVGFTIKPSKLADAEGEIDLFFRMKFSGCSEGIDKIVYGFKNNPFDLALVNLQASLFDKVQTKGDGPAGGTRVELSNGKTAWLVGEGKTPEATDGQEEAPPPIVQAIMDGEKFEDAVAKVESAAPLASAREMAGGTTDAAKKARGPRKMVSAEHVN